MKVLYYAHEFYCNYGARTHAQEFYKALANHKSVTTALLFPQIDSSSLSRPRSFKSRLLGNPFWVKVIKNVRLFFPFGKDFNALCKMIESNTPDVLIIRVNRKFKYLKVLKGKYPFLKVCVEANATSFDEGKSTYKFVKFWRMREAIELQYADSISVVSDNLKNYFLSKNPQLESKIFTNPNGVDVRLFQPGSKAARAKMRDRFRIPKEAVVFGYIGGMESFRKLPEVVKRLGDLKRSGLQNLHLMLVGTGQDLVAVLQARDEAKEVWQHSFYCNGEWIPHHEIPGILSGFDVCIFPFSNQYGSPQKIYEYMATGLPVLAADVPAVSEHIPRKYLPYLVKQDGSNFEDLARHMYDNLEHVSEEAKAGRAFVEKNFTWEENVQRILDSLN